MQIIKFYQKKKKKIEEPLNMCMSVCLGASIILLAYNLQVPFN